MTPKSPVMSRPQRTRLSSLERAGLSTVQDVLKGVPPQRNSPAADLLAAIGSIDFTLSYTGRGAGGTWSGSPGRLPIKCGGRSICINTINLTCEDGAYGCVVTPDGADDFAVPNENVEVLCRDPVYLIITATLPSCGTVVIEVAGAA